MLAAASVMWFKQEIFTESLNEESRIEYHIEDQEMSMPEKILLVSFIIRDDRIYFKEYRIFFGPFFERDRGTGPASRFAFADICLPERNPDSQGLVSASPTQTGQDAFCIPPRLYYLFS